MKTRDWLNDIIDKGLLCEQYTDKVVNAKSKRQLMDIVLDVNGASYLQEMMSKGYPLPYDTIREEFDAYVNGKYISTSVSSSGNEYTCSMYIDQKDRIIAKTDVISMLNCQCELEIPKNMCVMVFLDSNCDVKFTIADNSVVKIEHWGDSNVEVVGGLRLGIRIKKR